MPRASARIDLGYLALDLPLGETMEWKTTAYMHQNRGQGLWGTPYVATPGGAPLSVRSTEYYLERMGALTALTWSGGAHEVNGGLWYETNEFTQARRFYGEPSIAGPTRDFRICSATPSAPTGNTTSTPTRSCFICRTRGR